MTPHISHEMTGDICLRCAGSPMFPRVLKRRCRSFFAADPDHRHRVLTIEDAAAGGPAVKRDERSKLYTYNGKSLTKREWANEPEVIALGFREGARAFGDRLRNHRRDPKLWPLERCFTEPLQGYTRQAEQESRTA